MSDNGSYEEPAAPVSENVRQGDLGSSQSELVLYDAVNVLEKAFKEKGWEFRLEPQDLTELESRFNQLDEVIGLFYPGVHAALVDPSLIPVRARNFAITVIGQTIENRAAQQILETIYKFRSPGGKRILGPHLLAKKSLEEMIDNARHASATASAKSILALHLYLQLIIDNAFAYRASEIAQPYQSILEGGYQNDERYLQVVTLYDGQIGGELILFLYRIGGLVKSPSSGIEPDLLYDELLRHLNDPALFKGVVGVFNLLLRNNPVVTTPWDNEALAEFMPYAALLLIDDHTMQILQLLKRYAQTREKLPDKMDTRETYIERAQAIYPLIARLYLVHKICFSSPNSANPLLTRLRQICREASLAILKPLQKDVGLREFLRANPGVTIVEGNQNATGQSVRNLMNNHLKQIDPTNIFRDHF